MGGEKTFERLSESTIAFYCILAFGKTLNGANCIWTHGFSFSKHLNIFRMHFVAL